MGTLAGSTVMLLTIVFGGSILAGACVWGAAAGAGMPLQQPHSPTCLHPHTHSRSRAHRPPLCARTHATWTRRACRRASTAARGAAHGRSSLPGTRGRAPTHATAVPPPLTLPPLVACRSLRPHPPGAAARRPSQPRLGPHGHGREHRQGDPQDGVGHDPELPAVPGGRGAPRGRQRVGGGSGRCRAGALRGAQQRPRKPAAAPAGAEGWGGRHASPLPLRQRCQGWACRSSRNAGPMRRAGGGAPADASSGSAPPTTSQPARLASWADACRSQP